VKKLFFFSSSISTQEKQKVYEILKKYNAKAAVSAIEDFIMPESENV
jgi:hypothetical protein